MTLQKLKYKIETHDSDEIKSIERYFLRGDISEELNTPISAEFEFLDKDKVVSNQYDMTDSFGIIMSYSFDEGETWNRLFAGDVEGISFDVSPDGTRKVKFKAYGATQIRYNYATPNQIGVGAYESMSTLFTGTATASDGTAWNVDSEGNYPNGLLYDTGFTYSDNTASGHILDLFTDSIDVPIKIGYGSKKKLDTIKSLLSPYGLQFILNDRESPPVFALLKSPAEQPFMVTDGVALNIGENVNQYRKEIDLSDKYDVITVISTKNNTYFDIYGVGVSEKVYMGDDIGDYEAARLMAKKQRELNQDIVTKWSIFVPPREILDATYSLVGRSVRITDTDDFVETASVIGLSHRITDDRWITRISMDNPEYREGKTYAEIKEELDNQKENQIEGGAYVRAFAPTSSAYHYAKETDNITWSNICAIGFGTSDATNSVTIDNDTILADQYLFEPILVLPVINTLSDVLSLSAYARMKAKDGNNLIKEIVLFGNTNSDMELFYITKSLDVWTRSEDIADYASRDYDGYSVIRTLSEKLDDYWPVEFINVGYESTESDCFAYAYKFKDADSSFITNSNPQVPYIDIDGNISESWVKSYVIPAEYKARVSKDIRLYNDEADTLFSSLELTTSNDNHIQLITKWGVPMSPGSISYNYVSSTRINMVYYISYSDESFTPTSTVAFWDWVGEQWTDFYTSTGKFNTLSDILIDNSPVLYMGHGDGHILLHLDVENGNVPEWDGTLYFRLCYADCVFNMRQESWRDLTYITGSEGLNTVMERAQFNPFSGKFSLTLKPEVVWGLWLTASVNETTGDIVGVGTNYVDYFRKGDLILRGDEFNVFVNPDFIPDQGDWDLGYVMKTRWNLEDEYVNQYLDALSIATPFPPDVLHDFIKNHRSYVLYSTKQRFDLGAPPIYDEWLSFHVETASAGSSSVLKSRMDYAPPYGIKPTMVYRSIGNNMEHNAGIVARAICSSDSGALREGFDKNEKKTGYIQFELDSESGDSGIGTIWGGRTGKRLPKYS